MKTSAIIILILVLIVPVCYGQDVIKLSGRIVDSKTNQPVPFTTIVIKGEYSGVISNMDGSFSLPIKGMEDESKIIRISCLGYETLEVPVRDFEISGINYTTNSFLLEGYYRDYIVIYDNYLNMYEAMVQIDDAGFDEDDFETSILRMKFGRINEKFPFDSK
ncbi:MAG: carboxypeptidase-like regulatory domain-containing protein [Bacteroidales bacterium]|nr:carboxypeptidase-like regulatory domain-containing protein [Bacteroidales bacterium]